MKVFSLLGDLREVKFREKVQLLFGLLRIFFFKRKRIDGRNEKFYYQESEICARLFSSPSNCEAVFPLGMLFGESFNFA